MRAALITALDGPAGMRVAQIDEPAAGDRVLLDVHAAGVAFPEVLQTRGRYQVRPDLPYVPGSEVAGVVRTAPDGAGVDPGDRVAAFPGLGGFAEVVAVDPALVFPLPDEVSFAVGAALPMNYLTMHFALVRRGGLRAGETVLVHGAAGGIGTATIQLARALGARVVSVVSTPEKAEFVRSVGSHEVVIADGFKDAVMELTGKAGVDMVVDPVGGDRFTDSLRCLAPLGRLLVLGFTAGEIPTVRVNRLLLNNIDVRGVGWGAYASRREGLAREEWDRLVPYISSGALAPPVTATYPLAQAGTAVALLGKRSVLGKVVVTP
jgi:NADPH2:quinone reductase